MIAFAVSITDPRLYEATAAKGIAAVAEPDSAILPTPAAGSVSVSYNRILDKAEELPRLEALVLLHQDTEIDDPGFIRKVREALANPAVGVAGCIGAVDVPSLAFWEGTVTWASYLGYYGDAGGLTVPGMTWECDSPPPQARTGEVEVVDGFLLVLSPWVVRNVRFDESLGALHGYDFDFCHQVRAAGRKIVAEDFRAIHHRPAGQLHHIADKEGWMRAHVYCAEKWEKPRGDGEDGVDFWKARARRAEAEAACARVAIDELELKHWVEQTIASRGGEDG